MIRYSLVLLTLATVSLPASAASAQDADGSCKNEFAPLREDAEMKGRLIKAAADRHAPPGEACKLISDYSQAEARMIKYVEANTARCSVAPELAERLKAGYRTTEALLKKVCARAQQRAPAGPVGDFDDVNP